MKIGIVTQPLIGNYGGILQNYALQQVLKQLGHDPITLDYQYGYTGILWAFMQSRRIIAKTIGREGSWKVGYAPRRSNPIINKFIEDNIVITHTFWNMYSKTLISQYNLDAIIVGSDQVWRPLYNPNLKDSFLGFTSKFKIKRIAYAASFGTDKLEYSPGQVKMVSKLIGNFDAISVREKSGENLVKFFGSEAQHVLDPTLLLGKEGFDKITICPKEKEYLGYYVLDNNESINKEISRIQDHFQLDKSIGLKENTTEIGPSEWLGIIKNAKFFLTDSFHGTVFCILFHIPFYTLINKERGEDRFKSLLIPLGLEHRLVESFINLQNTNDEIDWDEVDNKLSSLRVESMRFLINAL